MPSHKTLTDAAVERLKAPATGQIEHRDKTYPGLMVRVSCGGRKTWSYAYRIDGKMRRMTLGIYPHMSVAQAHDEWREKNRQVRLKKDPAVDTRVPTEFASVFEEWIRKDQSKNRTWEKVESAVKRHAVPHWRHTPIAEITKRDVLAVIDRVADKGTPIAARRLFAYLHRLFTWAISRDLIQINPLAGLDKPARENERDRVLSDVEIKRVWNAAVRLGGPHGDAFRLLLLTGARREEIGQLRWSEIEDNTIKLSGKRTKNGEPHHIPLSTAARAILDNMHRIEDSDFVFTLSGRSAIGGWSDAKANLDDLAAIADWVTHDLRRTCATGLQKLKTPLQVTEAILGHTAGSRGGIVGVYQRHDYADEKRSALEAWGAHVTALVNGEVRGKVLPMQGRA
jgi:integrase